MKLNNKSLLSTFLIPFLVLSFSLIVIAFFVLQYHLSNEYQKQHFIQIQKDADKINLLLKNKYRSIVLRSIDDPKKYERLLSALKVDMKRSIYDELSDLRYVGFIYNTKLNKQVLTLDSNIDYQSFIDAKIDKSVIHSNYITYKLTFFPFNWDIYILKTTFDLKKEIQNDLNFFIIFTILVLLINSTLFVILIYNSMFKDIQSILSYFNNNIFKKNFHLLDTKMHSKETLILKNGINKAMTEIIKYESELKKSNQTLKQSLHELNSIKNEQDKLLSLFDTGESTLFQWNNDEKWSISYISKSILKTLGFSKNEIILNKTSYKKAIYKPDLLKVTQEIEHAIENDLYYINNEPYRMLTKEGSLKWVISRSIIMKDDNGKILSFIGHLIDIDDIKKQEELLIQKSKMASLVEMINNIAHQWRQPLSIISTAATGMAMQKQIGKLKDKALLKNLDIINESAQYLSETINIFRSYLNERKEYREVIIQDRIKIAINIVEASLKDQYIELTHNLDAIPPIKINLILGELSEVIINILNNARDALIQEKPKKPKIEIHLEEQKEKVVISIKDNAGGIPIDILPKIFEPYFTTKHKAIGTGLGLHMSYKIITESLKGKLYAQNIKKGAQLIIELPLKEK